jgi:hypothetical protein
LIEHDLYLDSETLNSLEDPDISRLPKEARINALRFALAVTYDDLYGWRTWTSSSANLLWTHVATPGVRVVGWDILEYAVPVLRHAAGRDEAVDALDLSAEIMAATKRHYRLDTVARVNLAHGKILGTQQVTQWLRAGDPTSMAKATEHCRNNVQLVMELYALGVSGQPLLLPGRLQPDQSGWFKTNEATLRLRLTPEGHWQQVEDLRGNVVTPR